LILTGKKGKILIFTGKKRTNIDFYRQKEDKY